MTDHIPDEVLPAGRDLRAYTDELRPDHPVVRNDRGEWVLLRHDLVRRAALDDLSFSSEVSRFLQVPNGLDGSMHTEFREALDPFLAPAALAPHRAEFERIAAALVRSMPRGASVEAVGEIGAAFAVRAQSAWLGWPAELEGRLLAWIKDNHAATRSGDRVRTARVAEEFDDIIRSVLARRRATTLIDVTGELLRVRVHGRELVDAEIVSVLRNWTGGDLGSIASCVGVLVHHLASRPELQSRLREGVLDAELDLVIDEVLRIDDPFVSNRRVTTRAVDLGGVRLPAGAPVKLHWTSANRDDCVFSDPDAFDPAGHASDNLVYGVGRHACPGRLLATLELRIAVRALLAGTTSITLDPNRPAEREVAPVGGWARVPVLLN
ncbi:cytochrome P450 [Microlunatus aurantiacus]|uniref:Cytochrome P450 n=1 Tax=Microlunatus aurantiacus TaxID=446786 RepID=A0ABP7CWH1_9ACTN